MERLFIVLLLFTGIWGCHYYQYIDKKMTWQDAQSYCRKNHSDLATISNSRDNNIALKSKTNSAENYVWIGLNNNNTQGAWRWSEDSSNASFYNWNKGEPNVNSDCVEMRRDGRWYDVKCHHKLPFICYGKKHRRYHYIDKKMTWQDAQSYCRKNHSDLATISNSRDNNRTLKSQTNSAENYVWIGLNKNQGAWRWSDSSKASFYNWNKGEPYGDGNCVEMRPDGFWNDMRCHQERPFICHETTIYHYIDDKVTWKDAQSYCREHYYDLATISNMTDNNIALKSQTNSAENNVWIGLNKNNTQGAWRWSEDSRDTSFYNWNKGEPRGDGNCVELRPDGFWNDVGCYHKLPFICNETTIYHYIDDKVTWQDAQSYCREHHSDLATISNMADNNIALKSKTNSAEKPVWIGLIKNQGAWRWSDSSNASFYNWNKDEPNGDGKSLHNDCVEMTKDGRWNVVNCNYEQPFVCLRSF
ncbi:Macrophage mannose receptor 1 [Merluccius polli]|uniref:Macrophage mannose receptor 1 n=1 Tax=Merluccius polli TaxID=89951 RepID=A0AA47M860_MERPO|nr:Macrophage mannose receptor 1 [Merluccius polli]